MTSPPKINTLHPFSTRFWSTPSSPDLLQPDPPKAYHLVRICQSDEWKTAFNNPLGHYKYLVISFGLTNTSMVFQSLENYILLDMINQFVFDILNFSVTREEHVQCVCLLQNKLFVIWKRNRSVCFLIALRLLTIFRMWVPHLLQVSTMAPVFSDSPSLMSVSHASRCL